MAIKKNKNIIPIKSTSELKEEIKFDEYEFKKFFNLLCYLIPNPALERLEIEVFDVNKIENEGLVYVFVIDDFIFKIGHTITSIKKRVQSYNCGKTEYRINGTNSTTNYFVLQSLLKINKKVSVFAYFPNHPTYEVLGNKYTDSHPPSKRAENILMEAFIKKYNRKPIGCTQK
jgi:hypothetical protein